MVISISTTTLITTIIIVRGADMNSLGWKGGTALHSAAEGAATEVSNFKEALQAACMHVLSI